MFLSPRDTEVAQVPQQGGEMDGSSSLLLMLKSLIVVMEDN